MRECDILKEQLAEQYMLFLCLPLLPGISGFFIELLMRRKQQNKIHVYISWMPNLTKLLDLFAVNINGFSHLIEDM